MKVYRYRIEFVVWGMLIGWHASLVGAATSSVGIPRDPSSFTPEMPLRQAIQILRHSTEPPLNIVVRWRDLATNADIYPDTPIGIDGVSGVPLRTHLESLLQSVSIDAPARIGYTVHRGVIFIGTPARLPRPQITRVYNVADLAPRSMIPVLPYGGLRLPPPSVGNQPILNSPR